MHCDMVSLFWGGESVTARYVTLPNATAPPFSFPHTTASLINHIQNGRMGNRMSFRPSPHVEFSVTQIDDMELVIPLEIPDSLSPHESLEASNWKTLTSFVPLLKVLPALSMQQNEYVGFQFLTLTTLRLSSNL